MLWLKQKKTEEILAKEIKQIKIYTNNNNNIIIMIIIEQMNKK